MLPPSPLLAFPRGNGRAEEEVSEPGRPTTPSFPLHPTSGPRYRASPPSPPSAPGQLAAAGAATQLCESSGSSQNRCAGGTGPRSHPLPFPGTRPRRRAGARRANGLCPAPRRANGLCPAPRRPQWRPPTRPSPPRRPRPARRAPSRWPLGAARWRGPWRGRGAGPGRRRGGGVVAAPRGRWRWETGMDGPGRGEGAGPAALPRPCPLTAPCLRSAAARTPPSRSRAGGKPGCKGMQAVFCSCCTWAAQEGLGQKYSCC